MSGDFSPYIDTTLLNVYANGPAKRVTVEVFDNVDGVRIVDVRTSSGAVLIHLPLARLLRLACEVAMENESADGVAAAKEISTSNDIR